MARSGTTKETASRPRRMWTPPLYTNTLCRIWIRQQVSSGTTKSTRTELLQWQRRVVWSSATTTTRPTTGSTGTILRLISTTSVRCPIKTRRLSSMSQAGVPSLLSWVTSSGSVLTPGAGSIWTARSRSATTSATASKALQMISTRKSAALRSASRGIRSGSRTWRPARRISPSTFTAALTEAWSPQASNSRSAMVSRLTAIALPCCQTPCSWVRVRSWPRQLQPLSEFQVYKQKIKKSQSDDYFKEMKEGGYIAIIKPEWN